MEQDNIAENYTYPKMRQLRVQPIKYNVNIQCAVRPSGSLKIN